VHLRKHPVFERHGDHLLCESSVSFAVAVLGGEVQVPTLQNGKATMKIPAGTRGGRVFRLQGKGMPSLNRHGAGDQLVKVEIDVPTRLNSEQREALQEFARLSGEDVESLGKSIKDKIKSVFT
ncbi:MAG: molecular chaperone DnaJ, partial [Candidatus Omnitrophica bacterium]|nr:molecular chaperone DnaJ [Candidatus Omnitrophota bacterium]